MDYRPWLVTYLVSLDDKWQKEEEKTPYYIPNSIYATCDGLGDKEEWKEQTFSMGLHVPSKQIYSYIETKQDILFIKVVMSQLAFKEWSIYGEFNNIIHHLGNCWQWEGILAFHNPKLYLNFFDVVGMVANVSEILGLRSLNAILSTDVSLGLW